MQLRWAAASSFFWSGQRVRASCIASFRPSAELTLLLHASRSLQPVKAESKQLALVR